jgi:nitrite reductase (NADH) small subunit
MAKATIPTPINLGSINAIPPGQGRCYVVGNQEIAVFRQRDGRLFATQNRCPHRQGPLSEGLVGNGKVICPLHAHHFDLESGKGNDSAECLQVFEASQTGPDIVLIRFRGNC